jgi:hypothetical protein
MGYRENYALWVSVRRALLMICDYVENFDHSQFMIMVRRAALVVVQEVEKQFNLKPSNRKEISLSESKVEDTKEPDIKNDVQKKTRTYARRNQRKEN